MSLKPLGWLSLVLLVALPATAGAEVVDLPPLPERNPLRAPVEAKPVLPGEQPTVPWTEAEIGAATAKCKELLTGDPLDYELLPPIKEGLCGTPAPVLLRAVGQDPKVAIEPPATLSCPMADVLGEWLRDTVQPEAKALFGSAVVKIQNASSYVCRNRYGGADTLLSEHALANAFDVVANSCLPMARASPCSIIGRTSCRRRRSLTRRARARATGRVCRRTPS